MPYITQVAIGKLQCLSVFGDDYATHDGTGVRDYIHVVDLAKAHLAALNWLEKKPGLERVPNVGNRGTATRCSTSLKLQKATGKKINYKIAPRRPAGRRQVLRDRPRLARFSAGRQSSASRICAAIPLTGRS